MNDYSAVNFCSECNMGKANQIFPLDMTKTKIKKSFGENDDDKGGYDKKAHVYTENCTACHSCELMCPVQAIS